MLPLLEAAAAEMASLSTASIVALAASNNNTPPGPAPCDVYRILQSLCLEDLEAPLGPGLYVLEFIILAYCFLGLAIVCDDYLAISLEVLCDRLNVREDVAGASFMAFGSAAPEIIINLITTLKGLQDATGKDPPPDKKVSSVRNPLPAASPESNNEVVNLGVGAILGACVTLNSGWDGVAGWVRGRTYGLEKLQVAVAFALRTPSAPP